MMVDGSHVHLKCVTVAKTQEVRVFPSSHFVAAILR